MPDSEKTIELLKEIADFFEKCRQNVSFGSKEEEHFWEFRSAAREAIELLKEQEAVKPKYDNDAPYVCEAFRCGVCDQLIRYKQPYCGNCGRKVQWEVISNE